jgi:hypothetical protein
LAVGLEVAQPAMTASAAKISVNEIELRIAFSVSPDG